MPQAAKRRTLLAIVCLVFLAVLAMTLWAWTRPAHRAWSGLLTEVRASPGEARLAVEYVVPASPAARMGLRNGDEIVAVNGIRMAGAAALAEASERFRSGAPVRLTVQRKNGAFDVSLTPEDALHNPFLLISVLLNLIAGTAFAGVGLFVFARRPGDTRALIFLAMSTAFGLTRLVSAGPYHAYAMAPTEHVAPLAALVFAVLFIFPLLLHFCLVFPRTRPILVHSPGVLGWIYGVPALQLMLLGVLVVAATLTLNVSGGDPDATFRLALQRLAGPFTARPLVTFALAFAAALIPAILAARRAIRVIREGRLRANVAHRPGLVAATIFFVPLCLFSLAGIATELAGSHSGSQFVAIGFALFPGLLIAGSLAAQALIFPIGACISFYRSYRAAGLEERQQMRWPLWGVLTAVAAHFLAAPVAMALAAVLRLDPAAAPRAIVYHAGQYAEVLSLLLIPVSFAFAILKHRLMDIHLYIRRTVVYGAVSGLLGLMYIALVGGLGALLSQWTGARNEWWTAVSTLLVAGIFVPVRNRVQSVVDTRFFRKRDYSGALHSMSDTLARAHSTRLAASAAAEGLQNALQCRSVEVLLIENGVLRCAATSGHGPEVERADIVYRDALLGTLALGAKLSDKQYDAVDRAFLATAAGQIAARLENLRLEREQRDLEKAREIQEALLPAILPVVPGFDIAACYQPARSVGGDYYDVLDLDNGKVALVMADVAGKGLPAALLMSNLQAAVKAFSREQDSPADLCAAVNRLICGNVTPGRYITFFYGVLDTHTRRLAYTNAGHNPPLLQRASGELAHLSEGGPILGFLRNVQYESAETVLESGDRLLIFTDGVSEAFGTDDEEFGEHRLIAILRESGGDALSLKEAVLENVTRFCAGNFHDDVTIIAVCARTGSAQTAGRNY